MLDPKDIEVRKTALTELLGKQLDVGGKSLERKVARAGRLLPRWARRDAALWCEAGQHASHPRLARRLDEAALAKAEARLTRYLNDLDPAERRMTARLRLVGAVVFNLLSVAGLFILTLWVLGHL